MIKKIVFLAFIFSFGDFVSGGSSSIASITNYSQLQIATQKLLDLNVMAKTKGPAYFSLVEAQAKRRQDIILSQINKDPGGVLKFVLSSSLRASLPLDAATFVEKYVQKLEGKCLVSSAISFSGEDDTQYFLLTDSGDKYILHFDETEESRPRTGDRILINSAVLVPGNQGDRHLIPVRPNSNTTSFSVIDQKFSSAMPPVGFATTGTFNILGVLLNFSDQSGSQPITTTDFLSTLNLGKAFYNEASSGQTLFNVSVASGWYTLPIASTCDISAISKAAWPILHNAGYASASYNRVVFFFPAVRSCSWAGMSWIGQLSPGYSESFINGVNDQGVVDHEIGHSFGLNHSHSLNCTGTTIGCTTFTEYGDDADTMGNISAAHFNAFQKENLGWLNQPGMGTITSVQTSGSYTIEPYETLTTHPKALKIAATTGSAPSYYYVEYRQLIGQDNTGKSNWGLGLNWNTLYKGNLVQGVLLHLAKPGSLNSSQLLDMNPTEKYAGFSDFYAALTGNSVFSDPAAPQGGIQISLNSATSSGAAVSVQFTTSAPTCTRAVPTLSFNPGTAQWVTPGNSATYAVTLTNHDSAGCGTSSFNFAAAPAAGGVAAILSSSSLTVAPGANGSLNLQIQSSSSTATGIYSVTVSTTNNLGSSGSAAMTLGVQAPAACVVGKPTLVLTPATQTVALGNSVTYSISIKNADSVGCSGSRFNIYTNIVANNNLGPSGITTQLLPSGLTINPGQTSTTQLQLAVSTTGTPQSYTVWVSSSNTSSNLEALASAALTVTPTLGNNLFIAAGSSRSVDDLSGTTWSADHGFTGGTSFQTSDPQLLGLDTEYKSERYGNFNYAFAVSNGTYQVKLKFAELYWKTANSRIFNVNINGTQVIQNLDIYAHVGYGVPYDLTFPVTVVNGQVNIVFTTVKDNAKISAIEISR
jgi:hypothetical protein